jgi:hypothetical protein
MLQAAKHSHVTNSTSSVGRAVTAYRAPGTAAASGSSSSGNSGTPHVTARPTTASTTTSVTGALQSIVVGSDAPAREAAPAAEHSIEDKRKPTVDAAAAAAAVVDSVTVEGSNVQSIASAAAADSDTAGNSSCSSSSTVCSAGVTATPALHAGGITFLVGGKEEEHPAQSAADKVCI